MTKKQIWFKNHLLLNLGFVPKLFGYSDNDLFRLAQGRLKKLTNGVEYYFGLTPKGTEKKLTDLPKQLVENKLIRVMHAPFTRKSHHYNLFSKKQFMARARELVLARADLNSWHRLPKVIELTSQINAEKIVIHATEIISAPQSEKLFKELDKLAGSKNILICLENNIKVRPRRKRECQEATYDPIKLLECIKQNNLKNFRLTIDTGHLAASGFEVQKKWTEIISYCRNNINDTISHFHLVDYRKRGRAEAAVPGEGVIGIDFFKKLLDDLFRLDYQGTISLEVAPINFYHDRHKLVLSSIKRWLWPFDDDLSAEEEYILGIIDELVVKRRQ